MENELSPAPLEDGFQQFIDLVKNAVPSPHTKRAYSEALKEFHAWQITIGESILNKATLNTYRSHLEERGLSPSSVAKSFGGNPQAGR